MGGGGTSNPVAEAPRVYIEPKRRWMLFIGIIFAQFSVMAWFTGIGTVAPMVLSDIGGMSLFALSGVVGTLGMAVMTPIGGKLCDTIGRRNVLLIGAIITFAGSLGMGITKTPELFVVFRMLAPFGLGLVQTVPYIVVGEIFEPSKTPRMFSVLAISLTVSSFVGGIFSGALYDAGIPLFAMTWQGVLALIGATIVFSLMPKKDATVNTDKLDYPGIVTLMLFMTLFTVVMSTNQFFGGYGSPIIIAAAITAVICLVLFFIIEKKAKNPLYPFRLFKNKIFLGAFLTYFFLPGYTSPFQLFTPLQAAGVIGASATTVGMLNMGKTVVTIVFTLFIGIWVSKNLKTRGWKAAFLASAIAAVAFAILLTTNGSSSMWLLIGAVALTGFTEGFYSSSVLPLAQSQFSGKDLASGTAIIMVASSVSGSTFSNIRSAIFNALWNVQALIPSELAAVLTPEQITALRSTHTLSDPAVVEAMGATIPADLVGVLNQTVEAIKLSLNSSVHATYLFTGICVLVSAVVAVTLLRSKTPKNQPE